MSKYKMYVSLAKLMLMGLIISGCGKSVPEINEVSTDELIDEELTEGNLTDCTQENTDSLTGENTEVCEEDSSEDEKIVVYVCGCVVNPGVYYLDSGAIVKDCLDAAGGFSNGAAVDYVNLAGEVVSGTKLYFPSEQELPSDIADSYLTENTEQIIQPSSQKNDGEESDSLTVQGKIDINKADATQLMELPGVGESKANAIIKYREEHGSFSSIEEIKNINGIKDGVFNNIKDYITIG